MHATTTVIRIGSSPELLWHSRVAPWGGAARCTAGSGYSRCVCRIISRCAPFNRPESHLRWLVAAPDTCAHKKTSVV